MANSLRAKISKLRHDGNISDSEYQEIIKKLDGHDAKIRTDAIEECIEAINSWIERQKCFKDTLKYIATNIFEELEKLKE